MNAARLTRSATILAAAGSVLATLAPIAAFAQDSAGSTSAGTPVPCDGCSGHQHSRGIVAVTPSFDLFRLVVVDGEVLAAKLPDAFDAEENTVNTGAWNALGAGRDRFKDAGEVYDDYNPFDKQPWVNGGLDVDGTYDVVGFYLVRVVAPRGDLYTKGWLGSDDFDDLRFTLLAPTPEQPYRRFEEWTGQCPHRGLSVMEQELQVTTRLDDVGGWSAASLTPSLITFLDCVGVPGEPSRKAEITYTHQFDTVFNWTLSAGMSLNALGPGGSLGGGVGGTVKVTSPYVNGFGVERAIREGDVGGNSAYNEIRTTLHLPVWVNDAFAAWEVHSVSKEEILVISEAPGCLDPEVGGSPTSGGR